MKEKNTISYYGWTGHNNIGDEALLLANKKIFNDFILVSEATPDITNSALYGGGTVIPPRESTMSSIVQDYENIFGIGVGMKHPDLQNQRHSKVDLGYILGKYDKGGILENDLLEYILKPIEKTGIITKTNHYITESKMNLVADFDILGVRGPQTKELIKKWGVDSQVVGDTALLLEPNKYQSNTSNRVAVTLRERGPMKWTDDQSYVADVIKFCEENSSDITFVFVPFSPGDIPMHLRLHDMIDNSEFVDYCSYVDVQSTVDEFSRCDFVIGERLHANVLSACSYTPFISLEYRPKSEDFALSIGMEKYNRRITNVTQDWVKCTAAEIRENRGQIEQKIRKEVDIKRSSLESLSNEIKCAIDPSYEPENVFDK